MLMYVLDQGKSKSESAWVSDESIQLAKIHKFI